MVSMIRTLGLALVLGLAAAPTLRAQDASIFSDVRLEAVPATNGVDPFPNELVLLKIRGVYRPLINIAHLVQPSLAGFGWMNLTRDAAFRTEMNGFAAEGFERTLAIFPEKSGELTIGSFVHKLTVVDGTGSRLLEVRSPPITLKVAEWQGPGGPNDPRQWWLPAREVRVIDDWESDPNHVKRGETVRRTVTIEAVGVTAEQLPPQPLMRSPGIISFRGPVDRETRVTETGPVARVTYRWNMRPTTAHPAIVEPIEIPWFDTIARTSRKAVIPAQRMAWAAVGAPAGEAAAAPEARPTTLATVGAGALAFLFGLGLLLAGRGAGAGLPALPPRALFRLRFAAWRGDAAAARAAVTELARTEPKRSAVWSRDPAVRGALAELDRHLFDAGAGPRPHLGRLARAVSTARGRAAAAQPPASALAPLDGRSQRA